MNQLGYADTTVVFTDRLGNRIAAGDARGISDGSWGRETSEVSQASFTIANPPLVVRNLEPWLHHTQVFRGDELVWRGPIISTKATVDDIQIVSRDPSVYFDHRRIKSRHTWFQQDAASVAAELVRDAMIVDDPFDVVSRMVVVETGIYITRTVEEDSRMLAEELKDLVEAGLTWTVVGGRLLVGPVAEHHETAALGDRDIAGSVAVTKDGTQTITDAMVLGKGVTAQWSDIGSPLGVLQSIDKQDAVTQEYEAVNAARRLVKDNSITPRSVQLPRDTRLMPTAPVAVTDLVCGARIPVQTTATGVEVNSKMVLTAVAVALSAGEEAVSVSLDDPPNPLEPHELEPPPHGYEVGDDTDSGIPKYDVATPDAAPDAGSV